MVASTSSAFPSSAQYYVRNGDSEGFADERACVTIDGYGMVGRASQPCDIGFWNVRGNRDACKPCDWGYTTPSVGRGTAKSMCGVAAGFGWDATARAVLPCPIGKLVVCSLYRLLEQQQQCLGVGTMGCLLGVVCLSVQFSCKYQPTFACRQLQFAGCPAAQCGQGQPYLGVYNELRHHPTAMCVCFCALQAPTTMSASLMAMGLHVRPVLLASPHLLRAQPAETRATCEREGF